jgi:probable rRNA maturation factor
VNAARPIALQNRHPRLRAPAREVRRMLALLDEHFRAVPADLPKFAIAPRARLRRNGRDAGATPLPPGELSVVFLTDAALAQLHGEFMDDPTNTDVITFEGDESAGLAGEICVSADTAASYARRNGGEFAMELALYLVHGWLHLVGYDDLRPDRKRRMRAAEARALKLLAAHEAIPRFRFG